MLAALVTTAYAQQGPVLIYGIMELSGTGATPGTNFDNGVKLAVKEINAAGGILGRKIDYQSQRYADQSGCAKAVAQKAVDQRPMSCSAGALGIDDRQHGGDATGGDHELYRR
jgi:branched-chain amino acid transport system substrate-binding protein